MLAVVQRVSKADVKVNNSATTYGSVICEKYEQKNSSKFYYDEKLSSVTNSAYSGEYKITEWQEHQRQQLSSVLASAAELSLNWVKYPKIKVFIDILTDYW